MEIELIGTPAPPASHSYEETIEDGFGFSDTLGDIFYAGIEDGLDIQETVSTWLVDIIAEGFILSDDSKLDWIKTIEDSFFAYCDAIPAWNLTLLESLISADAIFTIFGCFADEYMLLEGDPVPRIKVQHILNDTVLGFDDGTYETFYLLLADEAIAITDGQSSSVVDKVVESLGIGDEVSPKAVFIRLATESLNFTDIDTLIQELIIEEGIGLGDVELTRWVFNVLIECGFDITEAFD